MKNNIISFLILFSAINTYSISENIDFLYESDAKILDAVKFGDFNSPVTVPNLLIHYNEVVVGNKMDSKYLASLKYPVSREFQKAVETALTVKLIDGEKPINKRLKKDDFSELRDYSLYDILVFVSVNYNMVVLLGESEVIVGYGFTGKNIIR